mmetsp:Transcript_1930/g.3923  ORF Transcript_1930/g.3923 Transcript_1930/m.3923 type:complete len:102 (-) Transcript_1930:250-555(-)
MTRIDKDGNVVGTETPEGGKPRVDVFGFSLSLKHAFAVILIVFLLSGRTGGLIVVGLTALSALCSKYSIRSSFFRGTGETVGRGCNVKGMKDLPGGQPRGG